MASITGDTIFNIPEPADPDVPKDAAKPTPAERKSEMMYKGRMDAFIKRETVLADNIQKAYSLILGQCTDLLQSKLKQQAKWGTVSGNLDAIELIGMIRSITFKFEDQKFLPNGPTACQNKPLHPATE